MPFGIEEGLGPGHIVLDGDSAPLPKTGTQPPIFGSFLWPNGWMDQDATWCDYRPRPGPHCVRCGPSYILQGAQPPNFGPCLLWPNGWMDEDATQYEDIARPMLHCVTWGHSSPSEKGHSPQFLAHVYCGQTVAHLSYC